MSTVIGSRGPGRPPGRGLRAILGADRRRARRYRLDLPVELTDGRGVTRDISELGLLFETTQPLAVGTYVEFNLVMGRFDPQGPYRVKCAGEIVRIESHASGANIAVHLRSYDVNG